ISPSGVTGTASSGPNSHSLVRNPGTGSPPWVGSGAKMTLLFHAAVSRAASPDLAGVCDRPWLERNATNFGVSPGGRGSFGSCVPAAAGATARDVSAGGFGVVVHPARNAEPRTSGVKRRRSIRGTPASEILAHRRYFRAAHGAERSK